MVETLEDGLLRPRPQSYAALFMVIMSNACTVFIAKTSWAIMKSTDSALLGHVGTLYLDASALADLWMSSTSALLSGGSLSVLSAQAVGGGDKKLVGVWVQVALLVLMVGQVPIIIAWLYTSDVMLAFGKSADIASICGTYSSLMCIALVGRGIVYTLNQYLYGVQMFSVPVMASALGMVVNIVFGLFFVLGWPIPDWNGIGFVACPLVTAAAEWTICYFLIRYVHNNGMADYWPGWSWNHITRVRVWAYLRLFVPASLAISSDFWRMSVMGIMAASLGNNEIGVFNVSYRIMWLSLIFIGAVAEAVGVQMSGAVGGNNIEQAKRACLLGVVLCVMALVLISVLVSKFPRTVFHLFTDDPVVLSLFERSVVPFCGMLIFMNMAVYLERFPLAFSKMRDVLLIGLVGSWGFQVPFSFLCITYWSHDLPSLYFGGFLGYFGLCVLYLIYFRLMDWEAAASAVQKNAETVATRNR